MSGRLVCCQGLQRRPGPGMSCTALQPPPSHCGGCAWNLYEISSCAAYHF